MRIAFLIPFFFLFLISCNKPAKFQLVDSTKSGIDFNNEVVDQDTFNILHNEYMYNGGGVGIADLNNDGLPDIIFAGNKVKSSIYLNKGDLQFEDISSNFEGLSNNQWISGIAVADVNSDGWVDLYFTSTQSPDSAKRRNQLWVNQGLRDGLPYFKELANDYGIDDIGHSMHSAFFDYDLDGDLDLYVLNNIVSKAIPTNYRPKVTNGSAINNDRLYKNMGNGKFTDVTIAAGIVYEGYGLGIAVGDVNKDGYPDLYISNDYISNDLLYINTGKGTFINSSVDYISYQSRFSMGNDMADVNNDGNLDVITMDMMPEQYFRKKQTINGNSYYVYINNEKYEYEPQYVRNMMHIHNGFIKGEMLPFSELGQMMGVYQTEWSWSPLLADFDNDGDKDLFITNGFPRDLTDKDFTNYKAGMYGSLATDEMMIKIIPIVKVSNYAFENTGNYHFENQTSSWGMDTPSFSNGASFADLDNDGDLDYIVNNINDKAFLYRNNSIESGTGKTNYIKIELKGQGQNTMGIGAKIELWSQGSYQYTEKFLSRGYLSSVDPIIHMGLGNNKIIDSIKITWPNGKKVTRLKQLKTNYIITALEKDAQPADTTRLLPSQPFLFESLEGLEYVHSQTDYIDFFHGQNIIQHKLSQIGPCMATGDLDNDGVSDLIIGASDTQPTSVYTMIDGQFIEKNFPGLTGQKKCTESDFVIFDVDGDGDNDVVAMSGGYQNQDENEYQHFLYRNDHSVFTKEKISIPTFPASVVRPFDYDGDGDQDLFVGARVRRERYPFSVKSYILINDKGTFISKPENEFDIGMVTDAVWTDIENDGWQDLLIAREWNSLTILKNDQGRSFKESQPEELKKQKGLWYSLASGDFDHDGDDDFIVGNLGDNHRFTISDQYPLKLYAIDIDKNGSIDPITASFWPNEKNEMKEYPVNYLDELGAQSPFFKKMFTSYAKFSFATIPEIINSDTISDQHKFHVNTSSSYILWNEKGSLVWEKLPQQLQFSPIKEMLVKDFNKDGNLDVLVTGNDFTFDVSTGYFDANKGLVLLGDGKRKFRIVPSSESGLVLNGQVESLVYLDGKNPSIIAGINRKGAKVFRILN